LTAAVQPKRVGKMFKITWSGFHTKRGATLAKINAARWGLATPVSKSHLQSALHKKPSHYLGGRKFLRESS